MPRPSNERLNEHAQRLSEHRKHPDVSLREHVASKMAALSTQVLRRRRVYLDTRYWLVLRDVAMGRSRRASDVALLAALRRLVRSGAIVCPLGDGSLVEVLRQSDETTRLATARLIDELSLGVTIQNAQDRLTTEVIHFMLLAQTPGAKMVPPLEGVWLKAAYALGVLHPAAVAFNDSEQLALAKGFFDLMWELTLEDLLTDTPTLPAAIHREFRETAADLTKAAFAHANEIHDWKGLYCDEVAGFFEGYADQLQTAFVQLYERQHPQGRTPTAQELAADRQLLVNAFTNLVRLGKIGNALPRAQIEAGVHAVIRWHRTRPFTAQDFLDIHHATAALPYCNLFLTEKFLGTALTSPPLKLASQFGVEVVWRLDEALPSLERLASQ